MADPFKIKPLMKPNFFERLFGRQCEKNAIIEINNRLAMAERITDVGTNDILVILAPYKTDVHKNSIQI